MMAALRAWPQCPVAALRRRGAILSRTVSILPPGPTADAARDRPYRLVRLRQDAQDAEVFGHKDHNPNCDSGGSGDAHQFWPVPLYFCSPSAEKR